MFKDKIIREYLFGKFVKISNKNNSPFIMMEDINGKYHKFDIRKGILGEILERLESLESAKKK